MKIEIEIDYVGDRDAFLDVLVAKKQVLHLGACDAPLTEEKIESGLWLHSRISEKSNVLGIDMNPEAVNICHQMGFSNIETKDIFDLTGSDVKGFDYILFTETIEHISNPGEFLNKISKMMHHEQKLIITTPNAHFWRNTLNGLRAFENNHPDHMVHFTPYTLLNILKKSGFKYIEARATRLPRKSESSLRKYIRFKIENNFPLLAETLLYVAQK